MSPPPLLECAEQFCAPPPNLSNAWSLLHPLSGRVVVLTLIYEVEYQVFAAHL